MAHIVVTGASGFVGRALVARLLQEDADAHDELTLLDVDFPVLPGDSPAWRSPQVHQLRGSIADLNCIKRVFDRPVDRVFHLASIPGGAAEQQYALARDVNLHGTLHLLEACKEQAESGGRVVRFVFASTVAVYGAPLPAVVDDHTPLNPQMSYGAHKLMGEVAVADFTRRGWVDGCSLRLPGVLARPPARTGQLSAFLSDMIRELGAGRLFTCPMSPQAATWAQSTPCVVDNLLHAATMLTGGWPPRRALALPALHFTMEQLVQAIAVVHGPEVHRLVRWAPDARMETLFGRFPPLATPTADALGFRHDGELPKLVRRAVA